MELNLWDNQISDLSPLAGLSELRVLDVVENKISDHSLLAGFNNIEYVYGNGTLG
jgi:Leucine-rich repeat (LRR) protein